MKLASTTLHVASVAAAVNYTNWQPAADGDSRSPCPVLNSLANHNILPHNGKNLTTELVVKQLHEATLMSTEIATTLALTSLAISPDPASGQWQLSDLKRHNAIEHDGSLSRLDVGLGGTGEFHQESFDEFLSAFGDATEITIPMVAAGRWLRMKTSRDTDPTFSLSMQGQSSTYFETAVFMTMLKNATTGKAPLEHIKVLFQEERLPYNEGWRPTNTLATFPVAGDMLQLALNTNEDSPADTYTTKTTTSRKQRSARFHHGF